MEKKWNGSVTVEAAFIMPIIIFFLFSVMYLAFYLHDMCRIQSILDKTLHKSMLNMKHEADIENGQVFYDVINERGVFYIPFGNKEKEELKIQAYLQSELFHGLFLTKINGIYAKVNRYSVNISVHADIKISLPAMINLFSRHKIFKEEYALHNPAETIRLSDVILDTGQKIKGVDTLRERLSEILSFRD